MNTNEVKIDFTNIAKLPVGTILKLTGLDLAMLKFIRENKPDEDAPKRADGDDARSSFRFSCGRLAFSVDSQLEEQVELMRTAEKRKNLGMLILEVSEYKQEILDDNKDGTGEYETRKTLQFVNAISKADAKALIASGGELAQEEQKYAPKAAVNAMEMLDMFDAWQTAKEAKAKAGQPA